MYTPRNPVRPGDLVAARELVPVAGPPVPVPDPAGRLVHLQFRRFAGCPICNLHLRSVARRIAEIEEAGVREVVVFHSPAAELARYADELPFTLVADPDKRLYADFGVESAARALLDPRAWGAVIGGVARSTWAVLRGRDRPPARRQPHGRVGLPGDFLITPDGKVLAVKYGEHAYDQWSVDELLALAAAPRELAQAG
ncbi:MULTISPECIES: peroxiredoxin-like family protein [Pseudofrankia]|uniref:peroxiredoxin-like family protein n=1 Tax=Pseudofrankia TaxID=2994363 RepID=UPI000234D95B|nr:MULTISPECIES: peroxiredoxin-like family protein [Pseudofrankia]OHV41863.1 alkyl hydroperoxide reductase [Pseudofrankia sp. EUN1h]